MPAQKAKVRQETAAGTKKYSVHLYSITLQQRARHADHPCEQALGDSREENLPLEEEPSDRIRLDEAEQTVQMLILRMTF